MAPGKTHRLDAKLHGYNPMVNVMIDFPVRFYDSAHRRFFHTPAEAMAIGYAVDGIAGAIGGVRHLWFDGVLDEATSYYLFIQSMLTSGLKPRGPYVNVYWDPENLPKKKNTPRLNTWRARITNTICVLCPVHGAESTRSS